MNEIGTKQCDDILNSFSWDSTGHEEDNITRKKERADSHIFFFRDWFNIMTLRGLSEGVAFKIYNNTFGSRSKFDEDGNVSLCDFDRQGYAEACNANAPKVDRKLFLADYYVYKNSARYFDIEGYKQLKTKRERIKFLNKYEDMGMILVPKDLVIYEKDEDGDLVPKGVIKEERLIAKEVKKCTNYGKEYNQNSLYDTVEDCLQNGEELLIESSKQAQADAVVNYLKYLNLEQRIIALRIQELELNKEESAVQDEISSLKQKLALLKGKHRAKKQERSNLQQEENKLQQEQDNLLR